MKIVYSILLGTLVIGACSNQPQTAATATATENTTTVTGDSGKVFAVLSPADFSQKLAAQPGVILDVRTPGEYKKGFIEGAKLMDIFGDNFDTELTGLDRNATYFVYCAGGGRSAECTEKMQGLGFTKVYDLDGGMGAWRSAGLPVSMPK
jgi:phage shock protein E